MSIVMKLQRLTYYIDKNLIFIEDSFQFNFRA